MCLCFVFFLYLHEYINYITHAEVSETVVGVPHIRGVNCQSSSLLDNVV